MLRHTIALALTTLVLGSGCTAAGHRHGAGAGAARSGASHPALHQDTSDHSRPDRFERPAPARAPERIAPVERYREAPSRIERAPVLREARECWRC